MLPQGHIWTDKFVAMTDDKAGKAKVISDGIVQKIEHKLRQEGRTDAASHILLKRLCLDVCTDQIMNKGNEPINQMWIQKVEDKVLKDFSNYMSFQIYTDGTQGK